MTVHWSDPAKRQLAAIQELIAQDSPRYPLYVVDRLTRRSQYLAPLPNADRVVPELDHPETWQVIEKPYRIVYRVTSAGIDILTVFHVAEQFPRG